MALNVLVKVFQILPETVFHVFCFKIISCLVFRGDGKPKSELL